MEWSKEFSFLNNIPMLSLITHPQPNSAFTDSHDTRYLTEFKVIGILLFRSK